MGGAVVMDRALRRGCECERCGKGMRALDVVGGPGRIEADAAAAMASASLSSKARESRSVRVGRGAAPRARTTRFASDALGRKARFGTAGTTLAGSSKRTLGRVGRAGAVVFEAEAGRASEVEPARARCSRGRS